MDKKDITQKNVSLDAQCRLAEILNDSPRLVSLQNTEWEIRALRMGSQWLIAKKCVEVAKANSTSFGDVIKQFAINIPAVLDVLTIALLNDKNKIYENGDESKGFSQLYKATRSTLEWDCDVTQFSEILFEVLQLLDVGFFWESHRILEIFRETTMTRKTPTLEQK